MRILCDYRASLWAHLPTDVKKKENVWEKKKSWAGDWSDAGESKKHCGKAQHDCRGLQKRKGWGGERRMGRRGDEWRGKEQWLIDIENLCCCKGAVKGYSANGLRCLLWWSGGRGPAFTSALPGPQKHQNREHTSGEDKSPDLSRPARLKGLAEEQQNLAKETEDFLWGTPSSCCLDP